MKTLAIALLSLALLAGACGSDDNTTDTASAPSTTADSASTKVTCGTGTISGAGSTFAQTIVQQWIKEYATTCPGTTVNYQGVGSGAGIQQFTAGTVDFAGSDVPMKPEEETPAVAKYGPVVHLPWSAGGIAVEYNLKGVTDLKLTPEAIAGIFAGTIKTWDDAAIKDANTGVTLPSTPIQVVHRSDGSGTTAAFTAYLTAVAPTVWTAGAGKDVPWPTGQGAKGSDGVTAAVKQADGAVGYAEVSFAKGATLGIAKVKNPSGAFVGPEAKAVSAALESAEVPADLKIKPNYKPTSATAYPISTPTFVILPKMPADPAKAKALQSFVLFALGDGQKSAESLYYAPLPSSLQKQLVTAAKTIGA